MSEIKINKKKLLNTLLRLWKFVPQKRQTQFLLLIALAILSSICEVFSIGLVLPFLAAITNSEQFMNSWFARPIGLIFPEIHPSNAAGLITIIFCLAALISGLFRISLLWATTRVAYSTGADLSNDIYRKTLYQPYKIHISRNSSEVINAISMKTNSIINNALYPVLSLTSSFILLVIILITLISLNPLVACGLFFGFGFIYVVIIVITSSQLKINGNVIASESTKIIKALQEGLGGIRDVLMDGAQEIYCKTYRESDLAYRKAQGSNQFIAASPRFFIEGFGMILIAIFAFVISADNNGSEIAIPLLGALAVGAVRLLPLLQQIFSSWTSLVAGQASVIDALELLEQPLNNNIVIQAAPLEFNRSIKFDEVSFKHQKNSETILENISFDISKGEIIGFMGPSGGGKSTILDLLMGLIEPTTGNLSVDDNVITEKNSRSWQSNIAHVPQNIFLSDATIAENIALGIPKVLIDFTWLEEVLVLAQLSDVVRLFPNGYHAKVGERGVFLSGGQRQRLGIARALYKNKPVLILDEATSALDGRTEGNFMSSLTSLNKDITILMVAHRLSTLSICSKIYEISDGAIKKVGKYNEMV